MKGGYLIRSLTRGSFIGLFLFGFIYTIVGPALPFLIEEFNFTLTQAGSIYSLRGFGMILAVLLAGLISDLIGYRKVILAGIVLWTLGLIIFSVTNSTFLLLAIWPLIGLGFGAIDTGLNALVAETNKDKGSALNRLHFWFGAGAFSGPLFAGFVLSYFHWRTLFFISAGLVIVYGILMYRLDYPPIPKTAVSPWKNIRHVWSLWLLLLGVVTFGYTGISTTFMGWINTYLTQTLTYSTWLASSILAFYSIGLAVGRLLTSFVAERYSYEKILAISAALSFCTAILSVYSLHPVWVAVGFGLTGFFFSALLPLSLAIGAKRFPMQTGTVTGFLISFGSLGRTILPVSVGFVADNSSLILGLRSILLLVLAIFLASYTLLVMAKRDQGDKLQI